MMLGRNMRVCPGGTTYVYDPLSLRDPLFFPSSLFLRGGDAGAAGPFYFRLSVYPRIPDRRPGRIVIIYVPKMCFNGLLDPCSPASAFRTATTGSAVCSPSWPSIL